MKNKINKLKGFTLVELLIVIALIAILSVAVLATINPIEQSNKARDARVQNDAAEVMNAAERYYASVQQYPWESFTGLPVVTSTSAVVLRSDDYGFGICSGAANVGALNSSAATSQALDCDAADDVPNLLISTSELKSSFAGKDEFEPVRDATKPDQALWLAKAANTNTFYVCYVPKANANRVVQANMRCVTTAGVINKIGTGGCVAAVAANWTTATTNPDSLITAGTAAVFRCVPE